MAKIQTGEPLTKVQCIAGFKGHAGVTLGHMAIAFGYKNPHRSVTHYWGQRLCDWVHLGSARGQITKEYPVAINLGLKNP